MNLSTFLQTIENSTVGQWHKTDVQNVFQWECGKTNGQNYIAPKTFETLAVYKEDIDISLVMTGTINENFSESWTQPFPDADATSVAVFLRYRGAVVYQWVGVIVDGGRYLMPMPEANGNGGYKVQRSSMPLARLLFGIYAPAGVHAQVEEALQRAGVPIL